MAWTLCTRYWAWPLAWSSLARRWWPASPQPSRSSATLPRTGTGSPPRRGSWWTGWRKSTAGSGASSTSLSESIVPPHSRPPVYFDLERRWLRRAVSWKLIILICSAEFLFGILYPKLKRKLMVRGINEFKSDTLIREKPFEAKEPTVTVGMSFKNTAVCV